MDYRNILMQLIRRELGSPRAGAEVGVHRGNTSFRLLKNFPDLQLWLVDHWKPLPGIPGHDEFPALTEDDQRFYYSKMLENTAFAPERRHILKQPSIVAADELRDGVLDFVFLDADHSEQACYADLHAWWPKLARAGLMILHDYDKELFGVRQAADRFAAEQGFDWQHEHGVLVWTRRP